MDLLSYLGEKAMKKGNGKSEDFFNLSAKTLDELCQSNLEILKSFMDVQSNYTGLWQEYLTAQMDRLSTAKDLSDVMATESGLTAEYTSKFSDANQRLYEAIAEAMEKQKSCLNIPIDIESMLPNLQAYENMLYSAAKKAKTSGNSTSKKNA